MNSQSAQPSFEVTSHFQLAERGAFAVGRILGGTWRTGACVLALDGKTRFTVSGIEFLDNLSAKTHAMALVFEERPNMSELARAFPIGSVLFAENGA
jgi:hypothetical protein